MTELVSTGAEFSSTSPSGAVSPPSAPCRDGSNDTSWRLSRREPKPLAAWLFRLLLMSSAARSEAARRLSISRVATISATTLWPRNFSKSRRANFMACIAELILLTFWLMRISSCARRSINEACSASTAISWLSFSASSCAESTSTSTSPWPTSSRVTLSPSSTISRIFTPSRPLIRERICWDCTASTLPPSSTTTSKGPRRTSKVVPMAISSASPLIRYTPAARNSTPPVSAICVRRPAARNPARPAASSCSTCFATPFPAPTDPEPADSGCVGSGFVGSGFVGSELIGALLPLAIFMYVQQARVPPKFKFRDIVRHDGLGQAGTRLGQVVLGVHRVLHITQPKLRAQLRFLHATLVQRHAGEADLIVALGLFHRPPGIQHLQLDGINRGLVAADRRFVFNQRPSIV